MAEEERAKASEEKFQKLKKYVYSDTRRAHKTIETGMYKKLYLI